MVLLHETIGMDPVLAAAISFSVSTVFNYLASMRFVFTHREDLSKTREFTIFVILSVIGLAINEVCMVAGQVAFEALGSTMHMGPTICL
jgi:putative flippase GtrA